MKLVIFYGPPASGKLTTARALAKELRFFLLDNHKILDIISPVLPYSDKGKSMVRRRLYKEVVLNIASAFAETDDSFITTLGNSGKAAAQFFLEAQKSVGAYGGEVLLVQLVPPKNTLIARIEAENRSNKLNSKEALDAWFKVNTDAYDTIAEIDHLSIDNSKLSVHDAVAKIRRYYQI
jgi:RNase adaptor protein for sRNA GlmZ degradation